MTTTILQPATLAHIVWTQPRFSLDCTDIHVDLYTCFQEKIGRVQQLKLIASDNPRWKLECTIEGTAAPVCVHHTAARDFAFHVVDNNPAENRLIQAVPTAFLFQNHQTPGQTKQVPIDPPYLCTKEETLLLLQHSMPEVARSVLQQFPLCIKVHYLLFWPAKDYEHAYRKDYSIEGPDSNPPHLRAEHHTLGTPEKGFNNLFSFKTRIILAAVFPFLWNLCAWDVAGDDSSNTKEPFTEQTLRRVLQDFNGGTPLFAYPHLQPTDRIDPTHWTERLSFEDLIPEDAYGPSTPIDDEFIGALAQKIQQAVLQVQMAPFLC